MPGTNSKRSVTLTAHGLLGWHQLAATPSCRKPQAPSTRRRLRGRGEHSRRSRSCSCRPSQPGSKDGCTQPSFNPPENVGLSGLKYHLPNTVSQNRYSPSSETRQYTPRTLKMFIALTHPEIRTFGILSQVNHRICRQHFGREDIHPSVIYNRKKTVNNRNP